MLKAKKKLAKKDLKEDTLVKISVQATSYYEENKKYINYASTALVVLIIAVVIYVNNRRANDEKATSEFAKVMVIYDNGANDPTQFAVAIAGHPERGVMGLKAIVDNYGNSDAGEVARFYLANAYYHTGQYDLAIEEFDKFGGGVPLLKASALAGLAASYEAKGDFAKAAGTYERAASVAPPPAVAKDGGGPASAGMTPEYLTLAARCYAKSGDKEKAIQLCKRIKKEFPTSAAARDVDRYIAQFSA